jgi:hypothetical protein
LISVECIDPERIDFGVSDSDASIWRELYNYAEMRNDEAQWQYILGACFRHGKYAAKNAIRSSQLYQLAADQGHAMRPRNACLASAITMARA